MNHARRSEPARPVNVLIIDESYLSRRTLQARLAGSNVRLFHCSRAEEAVAVAAESGPDYIFIDYALSATNPLALRRDLANDPRTASIPVRFVVDEREDVGGTIGGCISLEDDGLERLLGLV